MFGWLTRCWGGMGVESEFERARLRSTISDWKTPDDADVAIILQSFKGQNPQILPEVALRLLLTPLELGQQKQNPIFLLKHLYLLDHLIEEQIQLTVISNYENSQFFKFKTGPNIQVTPVREFVAAYFQYIKKKAQIFLKMNTDILCSRKIQRQKIIDNLETEQINKIIDYCLQLQASINRVNRIFKGKNKSAELIQSIFTMLFKTFLFQYSVISACAVNYFKKLNKLSLIQANKFLKFIKFYNKEYTEQILDFITSNKEIKEFNEFRFSQIITIDKKFIKYLQGFVYDLQNKPVSLNFEQKINMVQQNNILELPQQLYLKLQDLKITYKPRKNIIYVKNTQDQEVFQKYQNMYSDKYNSQFQISKRNFFNNQLIAKNGQIDRTLTSSRLAKSKISSYDVQLAIAAKFSQSTWNKWVNVYSS